MTKPTTCHTLGSTSVRQKNVEVYHFLSVGDTSFLDVCRYFQYKLIKKLPIWLLMLSGFFMSTNQFETESSIPHSGSVVTNEALYVSPSDLPGLPAKETRILTNTIKQL